MTLANMGSCGTFVAPLMTALLLVSVPGASVLAQTPQSPSNVTVPPGYSITAVTTGLNFPTAMTFYRDTKATAVKAKASRSLVIPITFTTRSRANRFR